MTKIYLCAFRRCNVTLEDGSSVMFDDRSYGEYGSLYTSTSEKEQKLIEKLPMFGDTITLQSVIEDAPKVKESENESVVSADAKVFADVTRIQDAIAVIKNECTERGLAYETIRSREKTLQKAEELNIAFPNLK